MNALSKGLGSTDASRHLLIGTARISPARQVALTVLEELEGGTCYAYQALARARNRWKLNGKDQALVEQMVYGVIRRRLTIRRLLLNFSSRAWVHPRPVVRQILFLSIYQLVFMEHLPAYAVVDEAVELTHRQASRKEAGFVNALLRRLGTSIEGKVDCSYDDFIAPDRLYFRDGRGCIFSRDLFPDPEQNFEKWLSLAYSYPRFLVRRWVRRFGKERACQLARIGNEPPPTFIRVNRRRTQPSALIDSLEMEGIQATYTPVEGVLQVGDPGRLHRSKPFAEGLFYTQDLTTCQASLALEVRKGEGVLDLCAGRGGKATHLAELVGSDGRVLAVDTSGDRLSELQGSARRLGLDNIECLQTDGRGLPGKVAQRFDAVLVDVPCSSTGVIRRRGQARYGLNQKTLDRLTRLQLALLQSGCSMLSDEGRLVYSTCSICPEENQEVVLKLLGHRDGLTLDYMQEYCPQLEGGDGGFVARLRMGAR